MFSRDRRPPGEILAGARDDLRPYAFPVVEADVTAVTGQNGDFAATLATGPGPPRACRTFPPWRAAAGALLAVLPDVDRGRLRRALSLTVTPDGSGWTVSGGSEPRAVSAEVTCRCPDARRTTLCKHVLAVHLAQGHADLTRLAASLTSP